MSEISYQKIATDGLWSNNPGLVQLLGLCPLLAVSTTTVNGLGLGLTTVFVRTASNLKAPFFLAQAAMPHLRKVHGNVVNIVDIHAESAQGLSRLLHGQGRLGDVNQGAYARTRRRNPR